MLSNDQRSSCRLLNNICVDKLTNLNIKGMVAEEGFHYTMKQLQFIKFLGLHSVSLNNWQTVCSAAKLEQFFLFDCNVDDEGIRLILEGKFYLYFLIHTHNEYNQNETPSITSNSIAIVLM